MVEFRMRVLFFSSFFKYKGSETYYTEEIKSIIKNYPNVEFLVYNFACKHNRITRYDKNVIWVEKKSRILSFAFLKNMIKIFTKFKPTILHSVYVFPSIFMGLFGKIFRIPSILHGRGTDINYLPYNNLKSKLYLIIASKLNNLILTVSKAMRYDCLRFRIPQEKVLTIYDGIDFEKFDPRGKFFFSNDNKLQILNIGRFSYEKCHKLIIETCKELKENNVDFHLTLIGIGPLKNQITSLIKKLKLMDFISVKGWINHEILPDYLVKADLFILPSLTEGLPISVLEAMSMELPVILTKVGGMPELALEIGSILIEKNNKSQLYNAIIYYINNPEDIKIGGKINRKFIVNNFNWDSHAKELYNIYTKLEKTD